LRKNSDNREIEARSSSSSVHATNDVGKYVMLNTFGSNFYQVIGAKRDLQVTSLPMLYDSMFVVVMGIESSRSML